MPLLAKIGNLRAIPSKLHPKHFKKPIFKFLSLQASLLNYRYPEAVRLDTLEHHWKVANQPMPPIQDVENRKHYELRKFIYRF